MARHRGQDRRQRATYGPLSGLGGEAVKRAPVVGDEEHDATKRPDWGRFNPGLEEPHTNSTRAIGALSPWRGPSLRIRR